MSSTNSLVDTRIVCSNLNHLSQSKSRNKASYTTVVSCTSCSVRTFSPSSFMAPASLEATGTQNTINYSFNVVYFKWIIWNYNHLHDIHNWMSNIPVDIIVQYCYKFLIRWLLKDNWQMHNFFWTYLAPVLFQHTLYDIGFHFSSFTRNL